MPNKKITYIVFIMIITTTCLFPAEYVVKIDNMELGRVRTQWTKNGWICISEIQYGEKYVVETRTLYGKGGRFDMYEAIFKTNNEIVAKILGVNKMGKTSITLYAYYDPKSPSVKTFNFNTSDLVLLDNNFIIPHFEMMLKVPQPVMNIIIPQALFNPSKTEKATGVAEMKRLPDGRYTLSYEGTVITITSDNFGIVKMEYSNGIIVERVKK